jgi:predicted RNase H-like HicB family nuclease
MMEFEMTSFIAILEKEENTLWGVHFPDLPGCVTAGSTADEAASRAQDALRIYMETMAPDETMPSPRNLEELKGDPEIAGLFASGAIAFRVPVVAGHGRPVRVNLSVDSETLSAIDEAAETSGLTRSAFMVRAAQEKILKEAV